ncbi:MAG: hypothetical protein ACLP1D_06510, partial [Xanthobacteraceae bacterium]
GTLFRKFATRFGTLGRKSMAGFAAASHRNESGFMKKPLPTGCLFAGPLRMRAKQAMNSCSRHANFTIALKHATP